MARVTSESPQPICTDRLPYCCNMHMFYWDSDYVRKTLEEGKADVQAYNDLAKTNPQVSGVLLEFILDDSLERMKKDAAVLNSTVKG